MTRPQALSSFEVPESLYRDCMQSFPIFTVDVLFFDPSRRAVLLGKRSRAPFQGAWYSIGGRLLKNEDLHAAAVRVAKQETGIDLKPDQLIEVSLINERHADSCFDGINYHAVTLYFACVLPRHTPLQADFQHEDLAWIPVRQPDLPPGVRERIDKALDVLERALQPQL